MLTKWNFRVTSFQYASFQFCCCCCFVEIHLNFYVKNNAWRVLHIKAWGLLSIWSALAGYIILQISKQSKGTCKYYLLIISSSAPLHLVGMSHWISWVQNQGLEVLSKFLSVHSTFQILYVILKFSALSLLLYLSVTPNTELFLSFLPTFSHASSALSVSLGNKGEILHHCNYILNQITINNTITQISIPVRMHHNRNLPQSHSSELSLQSACPSHQSSRGTHSWLAHSSSCSSQNAARKKNAVHTEKEMISMKCTLRLEKKKKKKKMKEGEGRSDLQSKQNIFVTKLRIDTTT